jgi:predicted alpha/beta-hydrolase family hydrolase
MGTMSQTNTIINGPQRSAATIVLAHGAGAGMDTEFMNAFAEGLAAHRFRVVRFEFPYMVQRRKTGKRRPPDREPALRATWLQVIQSLKSRKLMIGGKSLGGRIASLVADEVAVAGVVCLGYPFHPAGRPERTRVEHLKTIRTPTLILQGERDPLGNREDVQSYTLSANVRVHWLPDGDHGFKPRKSSGRTAEQNWSAGIEAVAEFVHHEVGETPENRQSR